MPGAPPTRRAHRLEAARRPGGATRMPRAGGPFPSKGKEALEGFLSRLLSRGAPIP